MLLMGLGGDFSAIPTSFLKRCCASLYWSESRGMKRPHQLSARDRTRWGDIKKDLSQNQLAGIGAAALAYNEVEVEIDRLFFLATGLSKELQLEVSTRLGGIDGKTAIIIKGVKRFGLDQQEQKQLEEILGDHGVFGTLKSYRDAVIHARLINAPIGIGARVDRRAKIFDVLLSQDALDALYTHLISLRDELNAAANALGLIMAYDLLAADDPRKLSAGGQRAKLLARFRARQPARAALPPIPEFPSEQQLLEALRRWHQEVTDALTG
jgi:hypothetical protein